SMNMPESRTARKSAVQTSRRYKSSYGAGIALGVESGPKNKLTGRAVFAIPSGGKSPPPSLFERKADREQKQVEKDSAPSAASETVTVEAEAAQITDMAEAIPGKAKEPQPKSQNGTAGGTIGGLVATSVPHANQPGREQMSLAKITTIPRWTVSSDGGLHRSLDGGATWGTAQVEKSVIFRGVSVAADSHAPAAAAGV